MKYAVYLMVSLVFMFAASSVAQADTFNGTSCNNWTPATHDGLGEPTNDRCNESDLRGTGEADRIFGFSGWDYIVSLKGEDHLEGGLGMDAYYAGDGNDTVNDTPRDTYGWGKPHDENHDHLWLGSGDDHGNISDGYDEPDRKEEIHGGFRDEPNGTDFCIIDNHVDDVVEGCERVRVMNEDETSITWEPNADASNTPAGVNIVVRPPNV